MPASESASRSSPASNGRRPRASRTKADPRAPPTAAIWAVSAWSIRARSLRDLRRLQPPVVGLRRLLDALAAPRRERLACVEQVAPGVVARSYGGHERPD